MAKGGRPGGSFGGGRGGGFGGGGSNFNRTPKPNNSGNNYRNQSGFNLGKAFFLGAMLSRGTNNNSSPGNPNNIDGIFTLSQQNKEKEKTVYACDYCGSVFENETEKCSNCGAHVTAKKNTDKPLSVAATPPAVKKTVKKRETVKFVALLLVIVIVFGAIFLLINSAKPVEVAVGDWAETKWFNFRVYSAESVKSYGGKTADDGYVYLLVGLSIINTYGESIDIFDNDFVLVKNGQAFYAELNPPMNGSMLIFYSYNAEFDYYYFTLSTGQGQTGLLMFHVPQGNYETYLDYTEYDDSRNRGKVFKVAIG